MEKIGLITELDDKLLDERASHILIQQSPASRAHRENQKALLDILKEAGKSKDVGLILAAEHTMLENEREFYSNSPEMTTSLNNALNEVGGA